MGDAKPTDKDRELFWNLLNRIYGEKELEGQIEVEAGVNGYLVAKELSYSLTMASSVSEVTFVLDHRKPSQIIWKLVKPLRNEMLPDSKLGRLELLIARQKHPQHILVTFKEMDEIGLISQEDLRDAFEALAEKMGKRLVVNVENRQAGLIINWTTETMVTFTVKTFN